MNSQNVNSKIKRACTGIISSQDTIPQAQEGGRGGGGGTPYDGLYGEALPERGTFVKLLVSKKGISQVEVYERAGKSDI